jgi:hypothetical protein
MRSETRAGGVPCDLHAGLLHGSGIGRHDALGMEGEPARTVSRKRNLLEPDKAGGLGRQFPEKPLAADRAVDLVLREPLQVDVQLVDKQMSWAVQPHGIDFSARPTVDASIGKDEERSWPSRFGRGSGACSSAGFPSMWRN